MFQLFRKWRQASKPESPTAGRVAGILGKAVKQVQTRFGTVLSKQERQLNIRQKKRALWIFCTSMSVLSGYWIVDGLFSGTMNKPSFLPHQSMTVPQKPLLPDSLDIHYLQQYKHWRAAKDSLPDSLKMIK
jgi:hypothetical protein